MPLAERIEADIKKALLDGRRDDATTLRGLKSSLLNEAINLKKRDTGLSDDEIISVLKKEAKRRQESADLYLQHGEQARHDKEVQEKALIAMYLPEEMSEEAIDAQIDALLREEKIDVTSQNLGQLIGKVKQTLGSQADGATIAGLLKKRINK